MDPFNNILEVLADGSCEGKNLSEYGLADWIEFILLLDKCKILLPVFSNGNPAPFAIINDIVQRKAEHYRESHGRIVEALRHFSECACKNGLRFIILKGAPLAKRLYGSEWARHYSDVDVLVELDDIPKADYVARECGFIQPSEYFSMRDNVDALTPSRLASLQAPFLIRHRTDVDHVSPYVTLVDNVSVALEVHDRVGGVDPRLMEPLIWNVKRITIDGFEMNIPSDAALIAMLIMFTYDDSETILANMSAGSLGLKLYLDLATALSSFREQDIRAGLSILDSLGQSHKTSVVLSNLGELFSDIDVHTLCTTAKSPWGLSYRTRLFDEDTRKRNASEIIRKQLKGTNGEYLLGTEGKGILAWRIADDALAKCDVQVRNNALSAIWTIPETLLFDIENFVFQLRIYPDKPTERVAEVRLDLFFENGSFKCFAKTSTRYSRGGKASRENAGIPCDITTGVSKDAEQCRVSVSLNDFTNSVAPSDGSCYSINAGIFKNHHARLFHELWHSKMSINGHELLSSTMPFCPNIRAYTIIH